MKRKILIMGAGGRDFHNFNVLFKNDPSVEVAAFTAAQIPFIEKRTYPKELAGKNYPKGIPVHPEEELAKIIKEKKIDSVVFSYSDVSHEYLMHRASLVTALGADFILIGSERTMLKANKPVITVSAVRTGCGKSGVTRFIANVITEAGKTPVVIRHPMPYGNLLKQKSQKFTTVEEAVKAGSTIEELEEFEHLLEKNITVHAGVDYEEILKRAEKDGDVIIWDGGNNDTPFIKPDLEITVADPFRAGNELKYYPGEANLRRAECVIINKVNTADKKDVERVRKNITDVNPKAEIIETDSVISVENASSPYPLPSGERGFLVSSPPPEAGERIKVRGKNVLVIEDGPTLTHGSMNFGAGFIAANTSGAHPVDVRPYAKGSIKETLSKYPALEMVLPAMGYNKKQLKELEDTINSTPADFVLIATPIDLSKLIKINKPCIRVHYEIKDRSAPGLTGLIERFLRKIIRRKNCQR